LTSAQKHVVAASFLGWTLDAFDFFLMCSSSRTWRMISAPANRHRMGDGTDGSHCVRSAPSCSVRLADRFGRRPVLMADVALYSVLGFATAFSQT